MRQKNETKRRKKMKEKKEIRRRKKRFLLSLFLVFPAMEHLDLRWTSLGDEEANFIAGNLYEEKKRNERKQKEEEKKRRGKKRRRERRMRNE